MRCLIVIAFALFMAPAYALAGTCSGYHPVPEPEFVDASAVFIGEVTSIREFRVGILDNIQAWLGWPRSRMGDQVSFRVYHAWKGVTDTTAHVLTGPDCVFEFTVGMKYLVYATGPSNALKTTILNRTAELATATNDIRYLSTLPELPLSNRPALRTSDAWLVLLVCAVVVAIAIWEFRRRRS